MTAHYLGIPMKTWRILGKSLENCSITELNWDGKTDRFTLERFNTAMPIWSLIRICCEKGWVSAEN